MMTLDEARAVQKNNQKKSLLRLAISTAFVLVLFVLLVLCTDAASTFMNSDQKHMVLVIVIPVLTIIAKYSEITSFLFPKEFKGEVVRVHIYRTGVSRTKGAGRGHGNNSDACFEATLSVKNKKGRTVRRTFSNGDVTSHLREGDEVVILRFVYEPILIRGRYWESSL